MDSLILLAAVPIILGVVLKAFFRERYEWQALLIATALGLAIAGALWGIGRQSQTADTEIINGKVTTKQRERVSCSHSYECNCTYSESCSTDSKGSRSCTTVKSCSTCYEHDADYNWVVATTVGSIEIDRVDRQGVQEPPRFTLVQMGDPVAKEHAFVNYVKGASHSLFHDKGEVKNSMSIPPYPGSVYDYYHVDRAISAGVPGIDLKAWSASIAEALRDLGPSKQVNFIVIFTNAADPSYASALERTWLGGKKNDVIVVIGTTKYPDIEWVRVLSWTDQQIFKVSLRDAIEELKTVDREKVIATMADETKKSFTRKRFRDFEYLASEIELPVWAIITSLILTLITSIGGLVVSIRTSVPRPRFSYR